MVHFRKPFSRLICTLFGHKYPHKLPMWIRCWAKPWMEEFSSMAWPKQPAFLISKVFLHLKSFTFFYFVRTNCLGKRPPIHAFLSPKFLWKLDYSLFFVCHHILYSCSLYWASGKLRKMYWISRFLEGTFMKNLRLKGNRINFGKKPSNFDFSALKGKIGVKIWFFRLKTNFSDPK